MKIVALCQAYNEELFIRRNLENVHDLVDQIVVTEGALTPHGSLPQQSTDRTWREILEFMRMKDDTPVEDRWETTRHGILRKKSEHATIGGEDFFFNHGVRSLGKITAMPACQDEAQTREKWEGNNKNMMLGCADLEDGDLIYILDCDEFIPRSKLEEIFEYFRQNPHANCARMREKQFAYGFKWWFPSSHPRFLRYKKDRHFATTNHFIENVFDTSCENNVRKVNITRNVDVEFDGMLHFCWSKHPLLIREKVVSFNRESFTRWFNEVYLVWPTDPKKAYSNNSKIPPYHGIGFTEGMHEPLRDSEVELPEVVADIADTCWLDWIREHADTLRIGPNYTDEDLLKLAEEGEGFWTP